MSLQFDSRFLDIVPTSEPAPLTSQQKSDLRAHMMDLEIWNTVIPPELFEFHGLSICRAVDVTAQEIISSIKRDLIEQESIFSKAGFEQLQDKIRSFLGKPGIELGIEKHVHSHEAGLDSSGEVVELDFIQKTLEPVIDHLQEFGPRVQEKVRAYRQALDPDRGTLYRKRKAFEAGIARINEAIAAILDQEQVAAQSYCPHYFEKIKTDGVDHSIYVGAAILENGKFDLLYLKNLRLWQLIVQSRIVRALEPLKPELPVPLESAHLILVQEKPLSIRFRQDERRFDVDGAYDIRHEIIKKRIDKAVIRGTGERLTQPGKIAIVYSHPREAGEYQEYLDYLCASGYLEEGVEACKLDDLQGIQGLKALRIKVSLSDQ